MALNAYLNNVQHEPIEVTASLTAALNRYYVNTASAIYTDPTPVNGEGFIVFVRNGTATVGGTAYSVEGTIVYRYYHSGAWVNYSFLIDIPSNVLSNGVFSGGYISNLDSILGAFEIIDSALATFMGNTLTSGRIFVGNSSNVAQSRTLSLSASAGSFALGNTGILTMPDAATSTRGLLNSTDWNTFNNKAPITSPEFLTNVNLTNVSVSTNTNDIVQTLTNNSSGTPAAGYGLSRLIKLKSSTTDSQSAGKEIWIWTTATHASRASGYKIQLMGNTSVFGVGFQDAFRISANGNSFQFDFVNHAGYDPKLALFSGTTEKGSVEMSGNNMFFNTTQSGAIMYFRPGASSYMMRMDANGVFIGGSTAPTAFVHIAAGTTAKAQIRFANSTAPTSPNDGDLWFDGTDLKIRVSGTTYTLTKV